MSTISDFITTSDYPSIYAELVSYWNGDVYNITEGSVENALINTQAYLYQLYKSDLVSLPKQVIAECLNLAGFPVADGLEASGIATFSIAPQVNDVVIPIKILESTTGFFYRTLNSFTIPAGDTSGTVNCVALFPGVEGNYSGPLTIDGLTEEYITNITVVASGGTTEESSEESIARGLKYGIVPALVSESDFVADIVSFGAKVAVASVDTSLSVPVLTLKQYGLSTVQSTQYLARLNKPVGLKVLVEPINTIDLDVVLTGVMLSYSDANALVDSMEKAFIGLIHETIPKYGILASYLAKNFPDLDILTTLTVNGEIGDYSPPEDHVCLVKKLTISLYDSETGIPTSKVFTY